MDRRNADFNDICAASFTEFLLAQRDRDDRIGDLARDFAQDDTRADARELAWLPGGAGQAFDDALAEYRTHVELVRIFS